MGKVKLIGQNELTRKIAQRLGQLWDALVRVDAAVHGELLSKEYRAVHPDGSVHTGKPTTEEIAANPIEDYWLTDLQAWATGEEAAIATYTAEVEVRTGLSAQRFKFEVGEVWVVEGGQWKCRYFHGTTRK